MPPDEGQVLYVEDSVHEGGYQTAEGAKDPSVAAFISAANLRAQPRLLPFQGVE
jgi:hypothetical protein